MKKIFTLLVTVGLFTAAANAQTGSRDRRDNPQYDQRNTPQTDQRDSRQYDQQNGQWDKNNSFYGRSIEMQIAQINRKYDLQVQRVKSNFFIRRSEKKRVIRSLEAQRQQEIRLLYARSGNNRTWKADRRYDSDHY